MQTENFVESDPPVIEPSAGQKGSNKRLFFLLHTVAFLAGLAVVVLLIYSYRETISKALLSVGFGFILLISLNMIRHFLRAASMYKAIAPEHRTFKYRSAVAARFGGEAVTLFSAFTGPFLGDTTKVVLMKKHLPMTHGASAVIIDNILYYTSVIALVISGIVVLVVRYGSSGTTMSKVLLIITIAMVVAFTLFALAILFKITPLTHSIDFLDKRNIAPKFLVKKRESILNVENNVFQFYHNRPVDFFLVFGISICVQAVSVTEVFFAMTFLGYEPTFVKAFIIESLTKIVNLTYGFIPANMGVYEGGNELILKTLGYGATPGVGVALALVRRGASLCGNLIGVIVLVWRGAAGGASRLARNRD
jgi:hypothetical protein